MLRLRLCLAGLLLSLGLGNGMTVHAAGRESPQSMFAGLVRSGILAGIAHRATSPDSLDTGQAVFRADATASSSYQAVDDRSLRVPDAAFSPATVQSSYDYPLDANGANTLVFHVNHWWGYDRLGLAGGYFELAGTTTADTGDLVGFAWQASIYGSSINANRAVSDGRNRTAQWGSDKDCSGALHVPCHLLSYSTSNGGFAQYTVMQVNQCTGEFKSFTADQSVYQNHSSAIAAVDAVVVVVGEKLLQNACTGASNAAPATTTAHSTAPAKQPAASVDPQFHGNCTTFRNTAWGFAQRASELQQVWWIDMQADYNNNYPPPSGGSVPGVTGTQVDAARWDMNDMHQQLNDKGTGTGLMYHFALVGQLYGIKDLSKSGPFTWATNRVFGAMYYLDKAAQEEYQSTGSGLNDYHTAQSFLSNGWDALKQLPCG